MEAVANKPQQKVQVTDQPVGQLQLVNEPAAANYDVTIIGGGPAGMTAAIYLARKKLKILMLTKDLGGQAAWSSDVENYLGFTMISGAELTKHFQDHMAEFNDEITLRLLRDGIAGLAKTPSGFAVALADGRQESSRAVIIASGKVPKQLGIEGEKEFLNRGVTYCAWCDGPIFKGKSVVIVGGGNSALDAALSMEKLAKDITIINVADTLTGDEVMIEKVMALAHIRVLNHSLVVRIMGDKVVRAVVVKDEQSALEKELRVDGVFVEVGSIPSTEYLHGVVKLNEGGEIVINKQNMSSQPGIFAAGDVTDVEEKQIIVAAGEGSKAAIQCARWLASRP